MKKQLNNQLWQYWNGERYDLLEAQLNTLHQTDDTELVITRQKLVHIRSVLTELRNTVIEKGFECAEDEIWFLKHVLPKYTSLQYLYSDWLNILSRMPKRSLRARVRLYLSFLSQSDHFIHNHYVFYQYLQLELEEHDHLYFKRGVITESTLHLPLPDPLFSTEVSDLFARFKAIEMLQDWLLQRVRNIDDLPGGDGCRMIFSGKRLKWTGEQCNLIELIYGLYHTGQLNEGKATIMDIARLMEEVFQTELGQVHPAFADIRWRKRLGPTHFLERMRDAVQNVVDDDLAYRPVKKLQDG